MADLPTGTVTFLYTDIEGSTVRWEQQPVQMKAAVERHDTIVRQAVTDNAGSVFRVMGDAFCAVFPLTTQAVFASLQAQRTLNAAQWDGIEPLKVRMALHAGVGEVRDSDYVGQPLNRIARLLATGYGGQILLSQPAADLLGDDLPKGVTLEDLGEHLLKDLQRPEHIYQMVAPDLPDHFPPLKTLDAMPNNLPVQLTSFIGREKEMEEVKQLLSNTRLLTLVGPGGTGKTRLSIQVAADLLDNFPDGIWLVELAPIADPDLIPQAVATALGVREGTNRTLLLALNDYLRAKTALLVLDNCEHLIEACAQLADNLLHICPNLHIFTSSREALGIGGETTYRVPSLTLPDTRNLPPIEALTQYEAVRLFIDRAVAAQPDFAVTNANAPALAQICHRLDGIPLAIELAAARVRVLTVEEIAGRLDDRFRLLTGGSRTALPRQQTLKALIDWSYDLLPEAERTLLRRLSVFSEGCSLRAAEMVCSTDGIDDYDVLDLLSHLVDKSLVVFEKHDTQGRYRLLETIRQYSQAKLMEAGESERLRDKHLAFFFALAEEAEPKLQTREQLEWFRRLDTEQDNLRAAIEWSQSTAVQDPAKLDLALRLVGALWFYWFQRGYMTEAGKWTDGALSLQGPATGENRRGTTSRAKALRGAWQLSWLSGNYEKGYALGKEQLELGKELEDKKAIANALFGMGLNRMFSEYAEQGRVEIEESVELLRGTEYTWDLALALQCLGMVCIELQDIGSARSALEEGLALYRGLGDTWGISQSLNILGDVARIQGDYARAMPLYEESLTLHRELGTRRDIPASKKNLGYTALALGEHERAKSLFVEGLALQEELGNKHGIIECIAGLAAVCSAQKLYDRAAVLLAAVEPLLASINANMWPADHVEYEHNLEVVQSALGAEAFSEAAAQGRTMTLEQAVAFALAE